MKESHPFYPFRREDIACSVPVIENVLYHGFLGFLQESVTPIIVEINAALSWRGWDIRCPTVKAWILNSEKKVGLEQIGFKVDNLLSQRC